MLGVAALKIIFLNRFFYPDHSATSQMLSDLAFALAGRGHDVQVITSRLTYEGDWALSPTESVRNVTISRVPTTAFGRGKLVGRALDYFTFYISAGFRLALDAQAGDVVVVKTDPPMLSVVAGPIARLKGARYINWLQDLFPEIATVLGIGGSRTQKWAASLLRRLRDTTLHCADSNVVLGERMSARLKKRRVPQERITIIANWADGDMIRPIDRGRNALRQDWNLEDAFVVGYSGNLGRAHSFETFLGAVAHLEAHQKARTNARRFANAGDSAWRHSSDKDIPSQHHIRWLFIGGGAQTEKLRAAVRERRYESVMFRPYQSRERLSESLSAPDVHLISLKPSLEGLIVPSKYYGIAAAGRPAIFVGNPEGELARVIRDSKTGFVIRDGDGVGLAKAILELAGNPELAAEQGERARQLFESKYDFAHAITAWENLLCGIFGEIDRRATCGN
jgi:glycosyltransferase involved in cell wall biosynthesis